MKRCLKQILQICFLQVHLQADEVSRIEGAFEEKRQVSFAAFPSVLESFVVCNEHRKRFQERLDNAQLVVA